MRPTASHHIKVITQNVTIFPGKLGTVWKKLMSNIVNLKLKFTKRRLTVLLLEKLRRKNQGTNEVENFVKNIGNNKMKKEMRRKIMGVKIEDARIEENEFRETFEKRFSYLKRKLGNMVEVVDRFKRILQEETVLLWEEKKKKMKKKISWLLRKWKNIGPEVQEEYEGVLVSDEKLKEKYGETEVSVKVHGDVTLSEQELGVLKLHPKFTTRERIDEKKVQAASEIMAATDVPASNKYDLPGFVSDTSSN